MDLADCQPLSLRSYRFFSVGWKIEASNGFDGFFLFLPLQNGLFAHMFSCLSAPQSITEKEDTSGRQKTVEE